MTVLSHSEAADPRAWRADTVDARSNWFLRLSPRCVDLLDSSVEELRRNPVPASEIRLPGAHLDLLRRELTPAWSALECGRGFVVLEGLDIDRYTREEATAIYWIVSHGLGTPFAQNVQGTLLYDVRDTGQSVEYGARFSVTSADVTMHTDNSFGDGVLDYVGLLCLQTAKAGGQSQAVSGYAVRDELRRRDPHALALLSQPFHVDRRGGVRDGESLTARRPVFETAGDGLLIRYLRTWIHAGHDKAGQPLAAEQIAALDFLDEVLRMPELRVEFTLERGQMFWINNRWILHNRTAFEDHPEPERKRHYVRLWLQAHETAH